MLEHERTRVLINTKNRAKLQMVLSCYECWLDQPDKSATNYNGLPITNLPINTVVDLFSTFILPIYLYGLPLWLGNFSMSSLQASNATLTKFLKRYLLVSVHSNNASIHFLTLTISFSNSLKKQPQTPFSLLLSLPPYGQPRVRE